ncbi:hypothetical protein SAMN00768000_0499 [Sulfobacillus thermosulfidooxidans DSM 9293]|uniref:Uncharacterized protein n=1 Tax=Sulfobacillus thermosulfidooxidans (strain DSM 9293 / VKM B-1269 / AT-1) TaxID=929705 RepID=A0A1W1W7M7_SULTA|nr:hypothetical protein SAMN00768000_0499 [Sulfobacillus thermosulfidooxidans DSM 9293]
MVHSFLRNGLMKVSVCSFAPVILLASVKSWKKPGVKTWPARA